VSAKAQSVVNLRGTRIFAAIIFASAPLCGAKGLGKEGCGACNVTLSHRTGNGVRQGVEKQLHEFYGDRDTSLRGFRLVG
jgi:hypothetical protein